MQTRARFAWAAACAALALSCATPAAAFSPDICGSHGVWPARVSVGENISISGSYTDFAEPGSVTAVFSRSNGQKKTFEAWVDGSAYYEMSVRFGPSDAGRWKVRTTFAEPNAETVVCVDQIQVVGLAAPDTSTAPPTERGPAAEPVLLLVAAVLGIAAAMRRGAARPVARRG